MKSKLYKTIWKLYALLVLIVLSTAYSKAQNSSGYYINWNVDHTRRTIKPTIPISKSEAQNINCYYVSLDDNNRFISVKYYHSGKLSEHSSYGAFEMVREYFDGRFEDSFRDTLNQKVENSEGVYKIIYQLNEKGYWISKKLVTKNNDLINANELHSQAAAISIITRDSLNRLNTEVRLNAANDTIEDVNGFKVVHFGFNRDGYISYRKFINSDGTLKNGSLGYAQVNFQCNQNGTFFEEEFRDEDYNLITHPKLKFARVNFREFDQYGKYRRVYYIDENGYPDANRAFAVIEYYKNTSRKSGQFYDRYNKRTEDQNGISFFTFSYTKNGDPLPRNNYNLSGVLLK